MAPRRLLFSRKGRYELLYLSIPLVIIAYVYADKFTLAGMGESFSVNLGLKYKRVVNIGLIIVSLITSLVILTVGMLPFLGLIIPNIVSIYRGDNLKNSLPHTALLGAVLCSLRYTGQNHYLPLRNLDWPDGRNHRQRHFPVYAVKEKSVCVTR